MILDDIALTWRHCNDFNGVQYIPCNMHMILFWIYCQFLTFARNSFAHVFQYWITNNGAIVYDFINVSEVALRDIITQPQKAEQSANRAHYSLGTAVCELQPNYTIVTYKIQPMKCCFVFPNCHQNLLPGVYTGDNLTNGFQWNPNGHKYRHEMLRYNPQTVAVVRTIYPDFGIEKVCYGQKNIAQIFIIIIYIGWNGTLVYIWYLRRLQGRNLTAAPWPWWGLRWCGVPRSHASMLNASSTYWVHYDMNVTTYT